MNPNKRVLSSINPSEHWFAFRLGTWSRLIVGLVFFLGVGTSRGAEELPCHDEEFLREQKVATDGASLLAFLRQQFPAQIDPSKTEKLIQQLGDGDFAKREEASRLLGAIGPSALPALQRALKNPDAEVAHRAKECIQQVDRPYRQAPAARLLAKKRPAGCVEVLLRYLPFAPDEETVDEMSFGLESMTVAGGTIDPAFLAALDDSLPVRRALAACLVGAYGNPEQRARVRQLWTDTDPSVRLRAAQGLLAAGETESIPVLIRLLEGVSTDLSWQAEELLHWVAGHEAPDVTMGAGSSKEGKACRAAWEAWWQMNRAKLDLSKLEPQRRKPGLCLTVVSGLLEFTISNIKQLKYCGSVWLCGCDGKVRWQLDNLTRVDDAHLLSGNHVLLAQWREQFPDNATVWGSIVGVTERDLDGKILWQCKGYQQPWRCQRLANGNTIITGGSGLMEVAPTGERVFNARLLADIKIPRGNWTQPLRNRRFFVRQHSDQGMNEQLVEFDPYADRGRVLHHVPLPVSRFRGGYSVEPMPTGHYLIMEVSADHIWEIDRAGKVVWQADLRAWHATPLRDGNMLVTFEKRKSDPDRQKWLAEINPAHEVIGEVLIKERIARDRPFNEGVSFVRPCLNQVRLGFATKGK